MGSRNLPFLAGSTVSYGFNKEEALELITSNPAKILGIAHRTGTLEAGKDANLFISSGDALEVMSNNIELLFLMGENISLNNHQLELYNKYLKK
jgi:imidazolonepropionase-like amidohydrolase